MSKKGFLTIQKDRYGNITNRIINMDGYYVKEENIYNECNQKISQVTRDNENHIISSKFYEYEYDEQDNIIKKIAKLKYDSNEEKVVIYLFHNVYDEEKHLSKCSISAVVRDYYRNNYNIDISFVM